MPAATSGVPLRPPVSSDKSLFSTLKPTCVRILASSNVQGLRSKQLVEDLQDLHSKLRRGAQELSIEPVQLRDGDSQQQQQHHDVALSPSLIGYVFFPLAQLLRAPPDGATGLPDRVRELIFLSLGDLALDWWRAFSPAATSSRASQDEAAGQEQWKVWEQLVLLGAVVLGGPPGKQSQGYRQTNSSDETRLAVATFLVQLLRRRSSAVRGSRRSKATDAPAEWEWDGESELPSLDDYEEPHTHAGRHGQGESPATAREIHSAYPTASQLQLVDANSSSRGALAHILATSLEIASDAGSPTRAPPPGELRRAAMLLARLVLCEWLAPPTLPASQRADRAAVLLPGFVSSAVRATLNQSRTESTGEGSRAGSSTTSSGKRARGSAPSSVANAALEGLAEVIGLALNDGVLRDDLRRQPEQDPELTDSSKVSSLEELVANAKIVEEPPDVHRHDDKSCSQKQVPPPAKGEQPASHPTERQVRDRPWLEHTLAQLHAAFLSLNPVVDHPSASVPASLVRMARSVLDGSAVTLSTEPQSINAEVLVRSSDAHACRNAMQQLLRLGIDAAASPSGGPSAHDEAKRWFGAIANPRAGVGTRRVNLLVPALLEELGSALQALPRAISRARDDDAALLARRATLLTHMAMAEENLSPLLVPWQVQSPKMAESHVHHLLDALQAATQGWETARNATGSTYPSPYGRLESHAVTALNSLLECQGRAMATLAIRDAEASAHREPPGRASQRGTRKGNDACFSLLRTLLREGRLRSAVYDLSSRGTQRRQRSVMALHLANQLLRGVTGLLDDARTRSRAGRVGRQLRKTVQSLAKELVSTAMETWEADEDEMQEDSSRSGPRSVAGEDGDTADLGDSSGADVLLTTGGESGPPSTVEFRRGMPEPTDRRSSSLPAEMQLRLGPSVKAESLLAVDSALSSPQVTRQSALLTAHRRLEVELRRGDAQLVSLLGQASLLLGEGFRVHLLKSLYLLVAAASCDVDQVRAAAADALSIVAHSTGYVDVRTCVLDNLDYLLGAASHRLVAGLGVELERLAQQEQDVLLLAYPAGDDGDGRVTSASTSRSYAELAAVVRRPRSLGSALRAPQVLVEVIRTLGSEAVTLVQDAVDEVLDAIDRFHGYEELCAGLLQVLDEIVGIMASDQRSRISAGKREGAGTGGGAAATAWAGSPTWHAPRPVDDLAELERWLREGERADEAAAAASMADGEANDDDFGGGPSLAPESKGAEAGPDVVRAVLDKAVPFLSHGSPLVRARCLQLLRHGTEVLAPQGKHPELLGVVNRAWPLVLARLGQGVNAARPGVGGVSGGALSPSVSGRPDRTDGMDSRLRSPTTRMTQREAEAASAALSEREPSVWLQAALLVQSLATHLPEFLGRKIADEAWPRLATLLDVCAGLDQGEAGAVPRRAAPVTMRLTSEATTSHQAGVETAAAGDATAAAPSPRFRRLARHSLSARIVSCVADTLRALVDHMGASLSERSAWQLVTNPELLRALDVRQDAGEAHAAAATDLGRGRGGGGGEGGEDEAHAATVRLYRAMARRNADAVWAVVRISASDGWLLCDEELRLPPLEQLLP